MSLTTKQIESLWEAGEPWRSHRIISARPGSGKTKTLVAYCEAIAEHWATSHKPFQGLAAISYTNVARVEVEQRLASSDTADNLLAAPHFVGTIDSFINLYLTLPFASGFTGYSGGRLRLVGEPHSQWTSEGIGWDTKRMSSPLYFDCYALDIDDCPVVISSDKKRRGAHMVPADAVTDTNSRRISDMKRHVWSLGFVTQTDSNYIALQILQSSESLTQAFMSRFPVIVIDEAQDMTEIQHAVIDHLRLSGHSHIVLVGDDYQAIYEWNSARPQLFVDKVKRPYDWSPKTLSASFRCSPAICALLTSMAQDSEPLVAAATGRNREYLDPLLLCSYSESSERQVFYQAVARMADSLSDRSPHNPNSDNRKTIAILTRSRNHVAALQAYLGMTAAKRHTSISWKSPATRDFLRVVQFLAGKNIVAAAKAYETMLINNGAYASRAELRRSLIEDGDGRQRLTAITYRLFLFNSLDRLRHQIPEGLEKLRISDCAILCSAPLFGLDSSVLSAIRRDVTEFAKGSATNQDRMVSSLFLRRDERFELQHPRHPTVTVIVSTIHGVKGETYDGVLLLTPRQTAPCGCTASTNRWSKILSHPIGQCESKRILYVAVSRAAQLLTIAAEGQVYESWAALAY